MSCCEISRMRWTPMRMTLVPGIRATCAQSMPGVVLGGVFVAGDDGEAGTVVTVGDGDAGVVWRGHGGGNAGHDFKGNSRGGEFFGFLTAAAEDVGGRRP